MIGDYACRKKAAMGNDKRYGLSDEGENTFCWLCLCRAIISESVDSGTVRK
jgi:hypothetical protein